MPELTVEAFQKLGIEFQKSDGTLRSATDVLKDLADIVAKMPDGAEKTALGNELMGKSWKELIPLLNEGSAGLAKAA